MNRRPCSHAGCWRRPHFAPPGTKTPLYCGQHKRAGNVNVLQACGHQGARAAPPHPRPHAWKLLRAARLAPRALYRRSRCARCLYRAADPRRARAGCSKTASYGHWGSNPRLFCYEHRCAPQRPGRTTGSALLLPAGPAELAQGLPAAPVTCAGTARRMPAAAAALAPRAPRQGRNTGHRPAARRPRRRAGSARARRKKDMVSAAVQAKARREQGGAGAARGAKCAAKGARAPGERPPPVMQLLGESACSGSRCARVGCGGPLAVSAHLPAAEQRPRHAGCLSVCALRPAGSLSGTLAVGTLCLAPDEPTAGPLLTRACGARRRAEARARRVRRGRLTGFLAG